MNLTPQERALLAFERQWWTEPGPKDIRIREELGLSVADYTQALADLADRQEAMEVDPLVVRRLRRQRDLRLEERRDHHRARRGTGS